MSFLNYLKEKWITYIFVVSICSFATIIYRLDKSLTLSESNASYIGLGWMLMFTVYIAIDYGVLRSRTGKLEMHCEFNPLNSEDESFFYPTDKLCVNMIAKQAIEYETYKAQIDSKSAEEMEFITRWVHDVKVPISAIRLILDSYEDEISSPFYQHLDQEIFSIEESIQRIFYELKSNRFYEDYIISRVNTSKLISTSLKAYSNFFSYKMLNIDISEQSFDVLTDEKWTGYIVSQIISNAVKYTPKQGDISIHTLKQNNTITISIKNSGSGISEEDLAQLFKKGYTGNGNRTGTKSTGYGLYLAKKLSDLLGHKLEVESEVGMFTVFHLRFIENKGLHNVTKM